MGWIQIDKKDKFESQNVNILKCPKLVGKLEISESGLTFVIPTTPCLQET